MPRKSKDAIADFTERALKATFEGTLIPPIVYLPAGLRKQRARIQEHVTLNPRSAAEIEDQIAKADPVGFLIAIMQGQPIPVFVVTSLDDGQQRLNLEYRNPDLLLRAEVAMELLRRRKRDPKNDNADFDKIINEAAGDGL
jgi:hypothetical protein